MADSRLRYTRQIRLSEIGEAGQARLSAAEIVLGGRGFARTIEEKYLRAAGVGIAISGADSVRGEDSVEESSGGAVSTFEDEAAREVGEGAIRALVAMREILGVGAS